MKDPMSLRLGPLAGPIIAAAEAASQTPSEWIRAACADKLGIDPPEMVAGNPGAAAQSAAANAARWKKKSEIQSMRERNRDWVFEDELPGDYDWEGNFDKSEIRDGVRMFPRQVEHSAGTQGSAAAVAVLREIAKCANIIAGGSCCEKHEAQNWRALTARLRLFVDDSFVELKTERLP